MKSSIATGARAGLACFLVMLFLRIFDPATEPLLNLIQAAFCAALVVLAFPCRAKEDDK